MSKVRFLLGAGVGLLAALVVDVPAHAAQCALEADFNKAIQDKNIDAAKAIEAKVKVDPVCGPLTQKLQQEWIALEITMAAELGPGKDAERERLLVDADQPGVSWGAAVKIGQLRYAQKRYSEAFQAYDRALEIIKNPSKTPTDPGDAVKKAVLERATAARRLAANKESGGGTFAAFAREACCGIYPRPVRLVPLPINFKYGTDEPTELGLRYEDELLQIIQEEQPSEILLVGHTDPRGSAHYNMELSWKRANAVARYLKSKGITAKIKTLGRGFYEKVSDTIGKDLSDEEKWALDRRVEWRRE